MTEMAIARHFHDLVSPELPHGAAAVIGGTDTARVLAAYGPLEMLLEHVWDATDATSGEIVEKATAALSTHAVVVRAESLNPASSAPAWLLYVAGPTPSDQLLESLYVAQQEWRHQIAIAAYFQALHTDDSNGNAVDYALNVARKTVGATSARMWIVSRASRAKPELRLAYCTDAAEARVLPNLPSCEGTLVGACLKHDGPLYVPAVDDPGRKSEVELLARGFGPAGVTQHRLTASAVPGGRDASLLAVPVSCSSTAKRAIVAFAFRDDAPGADDTLLVVLPRLLAPLLVTAVNCVGPLLRERLAQRMQCELANAVASGDDFFGGLARALARTFEGSARLDTPEGQMLAMFSAADDEHGSGERLVLNLTLSLERAANLDLNVALDVVGLPLGGLSPEQIAEVVRSESRPFAQQYMTARQIALADQLADTYDRHRRDHLEFYRSAIQALADALGAHAYIVEAYGEGEPSVFATSKLAPKQQFSTKTLSEIRDGGGLTNRGIYTDGRTLTPSIWSLVVTVDDGSPPLTVIEHAIVSSFGRHLLTYARSFRAILDRDTVIQTVPHDLTHPVGIINDRVFGITRKLKRQGDVHGILDKIGDIAVANDYNRLLVDNMLVATGATMDRTEPTMVRLVDEVLFPAGNVTRLLAQDRGLTSDFLEVDPSAYLPEFLAVKGELMLIFYNLFTNAIKYYAGDRADFRVRVRAERDDIVVSAMRVHVEDDGIGVPHPWCRYIFDRGKRAPNVRKKQGLGIGLYAARAVAERFGGTLDLSRRRRPTTFTLTIPNVPKR